MGSSAEVTETGALIPGLCARKPSMVGEDRPSVEDVFLARNLILEMMDDEWAAARALQV